MSYHNQHQQSVSSKKSTKYNNKFKNMTFENKDQKIDMTISTQYVFENTVFQNDFLIITKTYEQIINEHLAIILK